MKGQRARKRREEILALSLLVLSFAVGVQGAPEVPSAPESFGCARYRVRGIWRGEDRIVLYPETTREFLLRVKPFDSLEALASDGQRVEVEFEIRRSGRASDAQGQRARFVRSLTHTEVLSDVVRSLESLPCGVPSRKQKGGAL